MVKSHFNPILADDEPAKRQTDGHLTAMSWENTIQVLTCQVSTFNYSTYDVVLWRELDAASAARMIQSGLKFDRAVIDVPTVGGDLKTLVSKIGTDRILPRIPQDHPSF